MARRRGEIEPLEEVISRAAIRATDVAKRVCEDIRGDILRMGADLAIHKSAEARQKVERQIAKRVADLERAADAAISAALGKAVQNANTDSGLSVKYSAKHTQEVLSLAQDSQGGNMAAVFSQKMGRSIVEGLRRATVQTIQEAAVTGLTLYEQKNLLRQKWEEACKGLGRAAFVDSSGHEWEARDYFTMNVRTNAMRVYNDILAGNITMDGGDLAQISRHGDPHCRLCFPWEGRIVSITGKTKGYPTYEDARAAGCFHPNCTHQLQTVDEIVDADEIEAQRGQPAPDGEDEDPMETAFKMDVRRKVEIDGMDRGEAEMAVKRDRLEAAIRVGSVKGDPHRIVSKLTDEQVEKLTDGVKVPEFSLAKRHESTGWNKGNRGGRIVVPRGAETGEAIEEVVKKQGGKQPRVPDEPKTLAGIKYRSVLAEQALRRLVAADAAEDGEHWLGGATYEQVQSKTRAFMARAKELATPGMYIEAERLAEVFRDGEFKTQFETGRSGGGYDPKARTECATDVFGCDGAKLGKGDHEKYGTLVDRDPKGDFKNDHSAEWYGDVVVRFKAGSLKATMTGTDSLNAWGMNERFREAFAASPLDNPSPMAFAGYGPSGLRSMMKTPDKSLKAAKSVVDLFSAVGTEYVELQYHGKVTVGQIESLSFASRENARAFKAQFADKVRELDVKILAGGREI